MSQTSMLVARVAEEMGAPKVVPIETVEDCLILFRKPRLTYIIADSTVQILVDGTVSHIIHYVGNVAIDSEVA